MVRGWYCCNSDSDTDDDDAQWNEQQESDMALSERRLSVWQPREL